MNLFAWALAGFVLIHIGVSATGLRARLVGGDRGMALSGAVLAGLGGAVDRADHWRRPMRADPFDPLNEPLWLAAYMAALASIRPCSIGVEPCFHRPFHAGTDDGGFEKGLAAAEPARGVLRITRHPFLWGVTLWGAGHLLLNGERFAVMLFGALALMAVLGARSIDRKGAARDPEGWEKLRRRDLERAVHGDHAGAQ
jgi:hypothetical protein